MKKRIKAIIFDVGGVLSIERGVIEKHKSRNYSKGVHEYVAKKLKISMDQYFDAIDPIFSKMVAGEIPEKKAFSQLSKNLRTTPEKIVNYYVKAYNKNFKPNHKLYKFALKLKDKGYIIAILSDQWYGSKKAHNVINENFIKKFDEVVISCDTGLRKPNPRIYKLILKRLKLPAKNCLFIDDQDWNIAPAKKLGMNIILFKDNEQFFKEIKKLGLLK